MSETNLDLTNTKTSTHFAYTLTSRRVYSFVYDKNFCHYFLRLSFKYNYSEHRYLSDNSNSVKDDDFSLYAESSS